MDLIFDLFDFDLSPVMQDLSEADSNDSDFDNDCFLRIQDLTWTSKNNSRLWMDY